MQKFTAYVVMVVSLILSLNAFLAYEMFSLQNTSGQITYGSPGSASICFNNIPVIDASNCNSSIRQNQLYSCLVTAEDADNDTITFSSDIVGENDWFSISSWGLFEFTPNQSYVGTHRVNITADDESGCGVSNSYWNFEVSDVNDAPYLETLIPNQRFIQGQSINFYLTDYFTDPDGDTMTFTKTITSNLRVTISGSLVTLSSIECGYTENVLFNAKDPYNLSADSNIVSIDVRCSTDTSSSSSTSSGGGGGGGGSSSSSGICEPDFVCGAWGDCQPNGIQTQKCVDLRNCDDVSVHYLERECRYVAHCYNEILDFDEEGIDCGGRDCKECASCFDGIQNGDELGIDCGGTCEPCLHCTNGILDFDEEGIDCGGEECEACSSCFDGIQNGDELGIDCGGPCQPCTIVQYPEPPGSDVPWPAFAAGIMIILVLLILMFKFYKNAAKHLFYKLKLLFASQTKKSILVTKEEADNLIRELAILIEKYKSHGSLNQSFVFDLMTISRDFYVKAFKVKHTIVSRELIPLMKRRGMPQSIYDIVKSFFVRIENIEKGSIKILQEEFEEMIEELKEIIYLTSPWRPRKGLLHKREDVHKLVGEDKIYALIHNSLFALEFGESEEAFKIYLELFNEYDKLLMVEKEKVYPDIIRLYKEILYAKKIKK